MSFIGFGIDTDITRTVNDRFANTGDSGSTLLDKGDRAADGLALLIGTVTVGNDPQSTDITGDVSGLHQIVGFHRDRIGEIKLVGNILEGLRIAKQPGNLAVGLQHMAYAPGTGSCRSYTDAIVYPGFGIHIIDDNIQRTAVGFRIRRGAGIGKTGEQIVLQTSDTGKLAGDTGEGVPLIVGGDQWHLLYGDDPEIGGINLHPLTHFRNSITVVDGKIECQGKGLFRLWC